MTRDEIDALWGRATLESVKAGEQYTRYRFAEMVAEAERDRLCAAIKEADGKTIDDGYMLYSGDCISVIRGTWGRGAA